MRRVFSLAALAAILLATATSAAWSQGIADLLHADPATTKFFDGVFAAKSAKDVDETMAHFSPDLLTYGDATMGINISSFESLKDAFAKYMPGWGTGLSYPVRIVGGPDSAIVAFTDTPELWGADLRILGSIDLKDGKIVRWVDYFDSTTYDAPDFAKIKTPRRSSPLRSGRPMSSAMRPQRS